jgi:hypothetical protein
MRLDLPDISIKLRGDGYPAAYRGRDDDAPDRAAWKD